MTSKMNDLIRSTAGVTHSVSRVRWEDNIDDLGEDITPDDDQGHRDIPAPPPISAEMNTRIRRAAGYTVRPGQKSDVPEIGGY